MIKNPKRFYVVIGLIIVAYLFLTLLIKPDPVVLQRYGLSATKALGISATVAVILAAIWLVAIYGFVQLLNYSNVIRTNKDGAAFHKFAVGLGLIAFRQPITTLLTSAFNAVTAHHSQYTGISTIAFNYIGVIVALAGFSMISSGSTELIELSRKKPDPRIRNAFRLLALLLITAYTYLAIGRGGYQTPLTPDTKASFYLPSWLIVSTIIVPYAYAWYLAFSASYNLKFYSANVKGVVYRKSLRTLAAGINIVIINTILLQFLSAQALRLNKLKLAPLLGLIYVLLISIGVGFAVVAIGVKKMKRIEEV